MSELTREVMLDAVKDLVAAFPAKKRTDDEQRRLALVYFEAMGDQTAEAVTFAVKQSIREERYFPAASTLLTHCAKWREFERKRSADFTPRDEPDYDGVCPNCHERPIAVTRYRPAIAPGDHRFWLTSADGLWLLLEPYHRDLCSCAAKSLYEPTPHHTPLAMPASRVTLLMRTKPTDVQVREVIAA